MKCPVCKTECYDRHTCPECWFSHVSPVFINYNDASEWIHTVVEPYRLEYWKSLSDYEISGKTVVAYLGDSDVVSIPYGIERIGKKAFYENETVRHVYMPETIKQIEFGAFYGTKLESVALPNGLEKIDIDAFGETNIYHISIPGTCKVIEDNAFAGCFNLKSVIISQGVTNLGHFAFNCCHELEFISIPESLVDVEAGAFATQCSTTRIVVDPRNSRYRSCGNCLIDKNSKTIVAGFLNDEEFVDIPNTREITVIGAWAYSGQATEYVITIPNNIREIGNNAFSNSGDIDVVIPRTVEKVGSYLFDGCNCNIFCEAKHKPVAWSNEWLETESSLLSSTKRVFWHGDWNRCSDMPLPEQIFFDDVPF